MLAADAAADGIDGPLEPWDWRYYSEKRRKAEHDLDEAELKPYLQLDRMIEAAFACANRLFGLEFRPLDVPLYHPDVRAWEVTREGAAHGGVHRRLFRAGIEAVRRVVFGDARPAASSAAICGRIVVNVCNFAKPEAASLRCCPMTMRARCSTNSAMRCTRCCRM